MSSPSSAPRGEHTPRPGAGWHTLARREQPVPDPDDEEEVVCVDSVQPIVPPGWKCSGRGTETEPDNSPRPV